MEGFYGNELYPFFTKWDIFSNHHPVNFELKNEDDSTMNVYNCTEQFLFAERAKACKDEEALDLIMKKTEPAKRN